MSRWLGMVVLTSTLTLAAGLWIPAKALLAQQLLELAWAESQARQSDTRPWPWADTWPVARLALPESGQSWIVMDGVHGESLAFGPGQVATSSPDRAAGSGPVLIAGHRDTHFRALESIGVGTLVSLQRRDGLWHQYQVTDIRVVDSRREGVDLARTPDDRLLLVTCYPFDSLNSNGPLRYVVEARRLDGHPPDSQPGRWAALEHAVTDT